MKNIFTSTDRQWYATEEEIDEQIEQLKERLDYALSIAEEEEILEKINCLKAEKDYLYNLAYRLD